MAVAISMPRMGQSVESCIITRWFKKKGDIINEGDLLFEYETDKASFEETSKVSGTLLEIFYKEGDEVPVLTNVAVIGKEGESVDDFIPSGMFSGSVAEHDLAEPVNEEEIIKDSDSVPELKDKELKKIKISPRARNMALKNSLDIKNLVGTGPNGRIIVRDIEMFLKGKSLATHDISRTIPGTEQFSDKDFTDTAHSNLRRIIASSMHASLQNTAQLTHHMGADARKILSLRKKIKNAPESENLPNITINDIVCYALIRALIKMPAINSHFYDDKIRIFKKVHLGLAVDTERGLMVPVLRNADEYSLRGLSVQLRSLAEQCRKGNIDPDLLQSNAASFTISNLGAYGIESFTPVLNPPQTGILGINTISYRPVEIEEGLIGFVPYIGLSLTYDHRAIDGAPASAFLREVKMQIELFDTETI